MRISIKLLVTVTTFCMGITSGLQAKPSQKEVNSEGSAKLSLSPLKGKNIIKATDLDCVDLVLDNSNIINVKVYVQSKVIKKYQEFFKKNKKKKIEYSFCGGKKKNVIINEDSFDNMFILSSAKDDSTGCFADIQCKSAGNE